MRYSVYLGCWCCCCCCDDVQPNVVFAAAIIIMVVVVEISETEKNGFHMFDDNEFYSCVPKKK